MKNNALKWILKVSGKEKLHIVLLILVQSLYGASGVLNALLIRTAVDAASERAAGTFWRYAMYMVLLAAGQVSLRALVRGLTELARSGLENTFKQRLLRQLLRKEYSAVSAVHSAEWLNRLTSDTALVADNMTEILPGLAGMGVKLAAALVMLVVLDRRFALILLPAGAVLIVLTWLFRKALKKLHKAVREKDGRLRVFLQEHISSMTVIHSFAAEERTEREAAESMAEHKAARMRKNRFSNICNIGFGGAMNGMYLFSVLWCGYGILKGTVSFGTLTAMTQLVSQIQTPFANITGYLPKYYAMTASAERLMEIEDYPDETESTALPLSEVLDYYGSRFAAVELRSAGFTYYPAVESLEALKKDSQPVVLNGLTLSLRKGETVAFTGASGCGKSTVLKLIMCLYPPDSGKRLLRGADGEERPLTPEWRRLFSYVPQGNLLLSGTIREAVSFAAPERAGDDEAVYAALDMACAEFVRELENGLDTRLGEAGAGLSEGQTQRLAVARAVFSGSPVLLLDEATSALDQETEKRLLENLKRLTDKTVVIVTHRPAALSICDRVLCFTENGVEEV